MPITVEKFYSYFSDKNALTNEEKKEVEREIKNILFWAIKRADSNNDIFKKYYGKESYIEDLYQEIIAKITNLIKRKPAYIKKFVHHKNVSLNNLLYKIFLNHLLNIAKKLSKKESIKADILKGNNEERDFSDVLDSIVAHSHHIAPQFKDFIKLEIFELMNFLDKIFSRAEKRALCNTFYNISDSKRTNADHKAFSRMKKRLLENAEVIRKAFSYEAFDMFFKCEKCLAIFCKDT